MSTKNANSDCILLGGGAVAGGIGTQIPFVASLAESIAAVDGTFKAGTAIVSLFPAAAPICIVGGLAMIGYELLKE